MTAHPFFFGAACVKSDAATDFVGAGVLGFESSLDAFDATGGDVTFPFAMVLHLPSLH